MMGSLRVANAPCSWGVLEFDDDSEGLLSGSSPDCDQVLDEIRRAGFVGTELGDWGFMPTEPDPLGQLLGQHELSMLAAFVPVALKDETAHAKGIEEAVRTARLLSAVNPDALIVLADDNGTVADRTQCAGRIQAEQSLDEAQWEVFARGAEAVARAVRSETALRTVFHFHCAGYVETPDEVRELVARTDPELLGLCFDTGHYAYGGGDPVEGLREHGDRVWHVHFKDRHPNVASEAIASGWDYFQAVGNGVFCELGQGDVDFPGVLGQLESLGYDGWIVVEQDVLPGMGSPFESAVRSRRYLAGLGL